MIKNRARISFSVGRPEHKNQLNHKRKRIIQKFNNKLIYEKKN